MEAETSDEAYTRAVAELRALEELHDKLCNGADDPPVMTLESIGALDDEVDVPDEAAAWYAEDDDQLYP